MNKQRGSAQVLIESTNGHPTGRAERYFTVQLVDDRSDRSDRSYPSYNNQILPVRIESNAGDTITATLLPQDA